MQRAFIMISLTAALSACAADNGDQGILITKAVAPGDNCTFTASSGELFVGHGEIEAGSPSAYRMYPQMQSRITATTGQEDQRTILLRGARVDIAFADSTLDSLKADGLTKFEQLFSAPLRPGGITDGAFDLVPAELLKAIRTAKGTGAFRTELITTFSVYGDMSGSEITSQDFQFPVTVCNGCVAHNVGLCSEIPMGTTGAPGNSCNVFQDGSVDCCALASGELLCPLVGSAPPI